MANQKYVVEGSLKTASAGRPLDDLKVMAYKFISASTMQVFGSCAVEASGKFKLEFEYGAPTRAPIEVHIMPIPELIEQFGVFNIERTVVGIFFPKVVIGLGDWTLSGGVYSKKLSLNIPNHIWRRWDWLSEEFTVIGQVVKREVDTFLPVPFAQVWAADADAPLPHGGGVGGAQTDEWGNFTITFRRIAFFIDYAHRIPMPPHKYGTEVWPDLIFHITQMIGGTKQSIYSETADDARPQSMWDLPHRLLYITLVTEEGITNDESYPPIPENFLFHGIGVIDPHSLHDGYATTGPADDLPNRKDCPFGGSLHIKGQFDTTGPAAPQYYQLLFARWDGPTAPADGDFAPVLNESWTVSKYDPTSHDWTSLTIEPLSSVVSGEKVYEIPDYTDITQNKKTRLIRWVTHRNDSGVRRYPDGKYDILVKAWDAAGNPVILNPVHPENNRLTVVLDNSRPQALLRRIGSHDILRTDEMHPYTPTCPVFRKAVDGPVLQVAFDATDENLHFLKYDLFFITGHNIYMDSARKIYTGKAGTDERFLEYRRHMVIPPPWGPPVASETKPPGGLPMETFNWNIGHPDVVPCAYQVRLKVWDRTINGYGYIHRAEDTMHFSINP